MAIADALSQLQPASWRGVPFPATALEVSFEQDHAEHKFPDRDGANVEPTGRAPQVLTATIPFRTGVVPGKSENQLNGRALYPDVFRAFYVGCADRTTGDLIHPDLGKLRVKVKTFKVRWDPTRRDGVDADVTWVESDDNEQGLQQALSAPSTVQSIMSLAADLDDLSRQMNPPYQPSQQGVTFAQFATSIRAIFDQTGLAVQRIGGVIDGFSAELDRLTESVNRVRSAGLWPILQAVNHLQSSLVDVRNTVIAGVGVDNSRPLRRKATVVDMTIAGIASSLGNSIQEIVSLNPLLLDSPIVKRDTVITYHGSSTFSAASLLGVG